VSLRSITHLEVRLLPFLQYFGRFILLQELFDFVPDEGDGIPEMAVGNIDEILSQLTRECVDFNSIVIPPSIGFSYSAFPFSQRELRTSIKVSIYVYLYVCM
jgi:hypothetical protein